MYIKVNNFINSFFFYILKKKKKKNIRIELNKQELILKQL